MVKYLVFALFAALLISTEAIQCNFTYVEADTASIWFPSTYNDRISKFKSNDALPFECEDPSLDDFVEVETIDVDTRIENQSSDEEFEEEESLCQSRKKSIQPTKANNIQNMLTKIAVVQRFDIEECRNVKENCSRTPVPANKRVRCKQHHFVYELSAVDDKGKVYDERFYFPAGCICQTYMKKSDL